MPGEEKEALAPFSAFADGSLVFLTLWISYLFWKPYRHFKEKRNLYLAITFVAVAIFKIVQFAADKIMGLESFNWMDSNLASELQIILLSAVVIWAVGRETKPAAQTQTGPHDERRAA